MTGKPRHKARVKGVTKDSALAKEKILAAAIDLFAHSGYQGTSTENIAEQAGYGQATVFFHFKTKEGLLQACLEQKREDLSASMESNPKPQGVADTLRGLDEKFSESSTLAFFSRLLSEVINNESITPIYSEFHSRIRETLSKELAAETGARKKNCDFAATALLSMMVGVHVEYGVEHEKYSREDYSKMLMLTAKLMTEHLRK